MPDSSIHESDFLSQIMSVIQKNITNEQFGVSELADEMSMSRSNLLRKVKKLTKLSVSQLISQVRLQRGMEMLRQTSLNVSEVSHQVGFSSTSYFIKCFREYYGYPPGEVGKREGVNVNPDPQPIVQPNRKRNFYLLGSIGVMVALTTMAVIYYARPAPALSLVSEKSIAVLPFKNESNDSTNIYLINGLMESTLNNLQKIKDLKVISRTSAEKYRSTTKSVPEMAKELHVQYIVEGSGQKIGDKILLNIQLIEASSDRHLWGKQYRRETKDIFELQQEIAINIAEEIKVIITPEEEKRIEKNPTDNLVAYDFFLKGKDLFYKSTQASLQQSIPYFMKAIESDPQFALAYANAVMVYYYLDIFSIQKKYATEISEYADKAMLFDPKTGESLIAKALSFAYKKEYESAVPYLEKALTYNPNSGLVLHFLTEFYSIYVPNTAKYLEYALKKVKADIDPHDSVTTSFNYLHLSNAFMQAGFTAEAIRYTNMSQAYNPKNTFLLYVKAATQYAKNENLDEVLEYLTKELNKDTTRIDAIEEVGKTLYFMRANERAYQYYKRFIQRKETMRLDIFRHENLRIGITFAQMKDAKASDLIKNFKDFADNDRSINKHLNLAHYYSYRSETPKALNELTLFSKEDNYEYSVLLFGMNDPAFDNIKDMAAFKKLKNEIETKFWRAHERIKRMLEDEELR
jgi:TolB-like protein/AraC-like DNA-binding protein/Tfp pilus assembly protein PilF